MSLLITTIAYGKDFEVLADNLEANVTQHFPDAEFLVLTPQEPVPWYGVDLMPLKMLTEFNYDHYLYIDCDCVITSRFGITVDEVQIQRGAQTLKELFPDKDVDDAIAPWGSFMSVPGKLVKQFYSVYNEELAKLAGTTDEWALYQALKTVPWSFSKDIRFSTEPDGGQPVVHYMGDEKKKLYPEFGETFDMVMPALEDDEIARLFLERFKL